MVESVLAREERAKLVRNERAKITATFFNGVAVALIAVGGLAPAFAPAPAVPPSPNAATFQALSLLICLLGAFTLHFLARLTLGALR